jgi:hypothetical protein
LGLLASLPVTPLERLESVAEPLRAPLVLRSPAAGVP